MPSYLEPFFPHTPAFLEVVSVYQQVWGGNPTPMASSIEVFLRHSLYPDWQGMLARDETGTVIGFAYGATVEAGQWWHDHLKPDVQLEQTWCLIEFAVLEPFRRHGLGQALHDAVLKNVQQPNIALSTQVTNKAALGFYAKNGYTKLLDSIEFTPGLTPYSILSKLNPRRSVHGLRHRAGGFIVRQNANHLEVLLMQRYKPERGVYYVIPGGSAEQGESLEQSAIRELTEETNVVFDLGQKLYQSCNPSSHRVAHYFLAQYRGGEPSLHPDAPENHEHHSQHYQPTWVKLEQVVELPLFPSIIRRRLHQDLQHPPLQPIHLEEYD